MAPLTVASLAERWASADAKERSNAQLYLTELTEALGVTRPQPAGSGYEFEYRVSIGNKDGTESVGHIDLFREGHFVLEAKDEESGKSKNALLQKAFGQARTYALNLPGTPVPYLMVLDVGKTLIVWDRWSGNYGGYNAGRRIDLTKLAERPEDVALLRDIWEQPHVRDPRQKAQAVTKDIAARLAQLASALESRGHDQEVVARFLIRCVFTMFAEDVGLLQDYPFQRAIADIGLSDPEEFGAAVEELWRAMDEGKRFGLRKLLRFNGHFFKDATALPLTKEDLAILLQAAKSDWQFVEPTIFGTLLTRALDPTERHRLGAEYTPREFVERLVRPTVEEPIRDRWTNVQAEVLQLLERGRKQDEKDALARLREFHSWLRSLQFLDPACGSGNFLYVTLAIVKRIEMEVLRAIEEITGQPEMAVEEVGPWQFHGIEIKPWARELAELTLWIGYHQFWREHHGHLLPPEPVLRDTGTLEQRDAVLAWEEVVHRPEKDRPDPTPRIPHPVTGELVPDLEAKLSYLEHRGARPAEWPQADFIVGNPPYLGQARQREAFGDGYVEALRAAYPEIPDSADYVMYWWHRAAEEVAAGRTIRAGLITTQSITQSQNRRVLADAETRGACVVWAIRDHAWCDGDTGAEVRVTMTVIAKEPPHAKLVEVEYTRYISGQSAPAVILERTVPRLNLDLSAHADIASASTASLLANQGLSCPGFKLTGAGFMLSADEAADLVAADPRNAARIKDYRNGKDLTSRPRGVSVIDFGMSSEAEAREYPMLFDLVRSRVKPERDANARASLRNYWWRYGEPRRHLREALAGLPRYIATVETAKHRFFVSLDVSIAPDNMLIGIALDDAFALGVLSSSLHRIWALAAGGALEDKPRYNKSVCFDPFPFPDPAPEQRERIATVAERLDRHRKEALARDDKVTMTGMYNVVEKLRAGEALTASERRVHEIAACGVLRDLHDELDRLVAGAYGWSWPLQHEEILDQLVALHDERVAEERAGRVRWLRPEYQVPRFAPEAAVAPELDIGGSNQAGEVEAQPWPGSAIEQIAALKGVVSSTPYTVEEAARQFKGARRDLVERHLETLVILGELRKTEDGRYHVAAAPMGMAA